MMDRPKMVDPTGALITTVRDYLRLQPGFEQAEVRGGRGQGDPAPRVTIVRNSTFRDRPARGTATLRYIARCYGRNEIEATACYRHVSDAVHDLGPMMVARAGADIGWFRSADISGGAPALDGDTKEPLESATIEVVILATGY